MTLESPAARAGQIARQLLLFGRPLPVEELVEKIEAITVHKIRDLATRIFSGGAPTLAAVGAINGMMGHAEIAQRFGTKLVA
jgi:predicted Zn-dependent peptidase